MATQTDLIWRANTQRRLVVFLIASCSLASAAQTVYRCEAQGKVVYSHEPCLGAKPVDITPTQGLDKSSGKSRKGADVRRAETDKMFGDAMRPITGMDDKQRATLHRRFKLSHSAKLECTVLDTQLTSQEAAERNAGPSRLRAAQQELFESRKRYRELSC